VTLASDLIIRPALPPGAPSEAMGPEALLSWAVDRFGSRFALATSLGPQSLILVDMASRLGLDLSVFFLDTDLLFDETYALRERVEARYGIRIQAVRASASLGSQRASHGPRLWERDPDGCCARRKVGPLRDHLLSRAAWMTGIRRSQGGFRAGAGHIEWDDQFGLWKLNPLVAWTREQVDAYIAEHDVPTNPLLAAGYRSVGCGPCTSPVSEHDDENDDRAGRWANRGKTECGIHGRLEVIR